MSMLFPWTHLRLLPICTLLATLLLRAETTPNIEEINSGYAIISGGTLRCRGCDYSMCASSCLLVSASAMQDESTSKMDDVIGCAAFDYIQSSRSCYVHTLISACLPLTVQPTAINTRLVPCTDHGISTSTSLTAAGAAGDAIDKHRPVLLQSNEPRKSVAEIDSIEFIPTGGNSGFLKLAPEKNLNSLTVSEERSETLAAKADGLVAVRPYQLFNGRRVLLTSSVVKAGSETPDDGALEGDNLSFEITPAPASSTTTTTTASVTTPTTTITTASTTSTTQPTTTTTTLTTPTTTTSQPTTTITTTPTTTTTSTTTTSQPTTTTTTTPTTTTTSTTTTSQPTTTTTATPTTTSQPTTTTTITSPAATTSTTTLTTTEAKQADTTTIPTTSSTKTTSTSTTPATTTTAGSITTSITDTTTALTKNTLLPPTTTITTTSTSLVSPSTSTTTATSATPENNSTPAALITYSSTSLSTATTTTATPTTQISTSATSTPSQSSSTADAAVVATTTATATTNIRHARRRLLLRDFTTTSNAETLPITFSPSPIKQLTSSHLGQRLSSRRAPHFRHPTLSLSDPMAVIGRQGSLDSSSKSKKQLPLEEIAPAAIMNVLAGVLLGRENFENSRPVKVGTTISQLSTATTTVPTTPRRQTVSVLSKYQPHNESTNKRNFGTTLPSTGKVAITEADPALTTRVGEGPVNNDVIKNYRRYDYAQRTPAMEARFDGVPDDPQSRDFAEPNLKRQPSVITQRLMTSAEVADDRYSTVAMLSKSVGGTNQIMDANGGYVRVGGGGGGRRHAISSSTATPPKRDGMGRPALGEGEDGSVRWENSAMLDYPTESLTEADVSPTSTRARDQNQLQITDGGDYDYYNSQNSGGRTRSETSNKGNLQQQSIPSADTAKSGLPEGWQHFAGKRLKTKETALKLSLIGGIDACIDECILGINICYAVDYDSQTDDCYIYTEERDSCQSPILAPQFDHFKVVPC